MISEQLKNKEAKLAVIGLGYVGLPVAIYFAKKIPVTGFDINANRIELLKQKIDPGKELSPGEFDNCDIYFTNNIDDLEQASFYIVCVPTPVDEHNVPDLRLLKKPARQLAK